jgi:hypothetical protein
MAKAHAKRGQASVASRAVLVLERPVEIEVPNLAVAIAQGATGHPTDDHTQMDFLITLALQWDLDPGAAARLLSEASS